MTRPLLVIDGNSFAHRSYHALPKTIRRRGNKAAGAILGFANFLLRLYESEQPRAVLVAWDSLDEPTYRHEALPAYQSGREFDDEPSVCPRLTLDSKGRGLCLTEMARHVEERSAALTSDHGA